MEPITVKSNLDLKTYYKRSMGILMPGAVASGSIAFAAVSVIGYLFFEFRALDIAFIFISGGVTLLVILPVVTWFRCKANMVKFPVLAEGANIIVAEDVIECVSISSATKSAWTTIKKGTEYDKYFILLAKTRSIYYLPKNGFSSVDDIEKFKKIVVANNIKNNFK